MQVALGSPAFMLDLRTGRSNHSSRLPFRRLTHSGLQPRSLFHRRLCPVCLHLSIPGTFIHVLADTHISFPQGSGATILFEPVQRSTENLHTRRHLDTPYQLERFSSTNMRPIVRSHYPMMVVSSGKLDESVTRQEWNLTRTISGSMGSHCAG